MRKLKKSYSALFMVARVLISMSMEEKLLYKRITSRWRTFSGNPCCQLPRGFKECCYSCRSTISRLCTLAREGALYRRYTESGVLTQWKHPREEELWCVCCKGRRVFNQVHRRNWHGRVPANHSWTLGRSPRENGTRWVSSEVETCYQGRLAWYKRRSSIRNQKLLPLQGRTDHSRWYSVQRKSSDRPYSVKVTHDEQKYIQATLVSKVVCKRHVTSCSGLGCQLKLRTR